MSTPRQAALQKFSHKLKQDILGLQNDMHGEPPGGYLERCRGQKDALIMVQRHIKKIIKGNYDG